MKTMFDFTLKLYEKYLESRRKAADTMVVILLFSLVPLPILNFWYWILNGVKLLPNNSPKVIDFIDFVLNVYIQDISWYVYLPVCIITFMYFICRIYKYRTDYINTKRYGCKINSKFFNAINSRAIAL